MSDLKKQFGAKVRYYRKNAKLTQEKFAELLDVTSQSISSIEKGVNFPSSSLLEKISDILKVPFSDFFTFDNPHYSIEDKELQNILVKAFKDLSYEKRCVVLKMAEFLASVE